MSRRLICSVLVSLLAAVSWAQPSPTLPTSASRTMPSLSSGLVPSLFPPQTVYQREIPLIPGVPVPGIGTLQPLPEAPGCLIIQPSRRWGGTGSGRATQLQPGVPRPALQNLLFANPSSGCPLHSHQPPVFGANGTLRTPSRQVFDQLHPATNPTLNQGAPGYRAVQRSTRASCWFGVDATLTLTCNRPFAPIPTNLPSGADKPT